MTPFAIAFNHLLTQNAWAREKLACYADKAFQLRLPPVTLTFVIDPGGTVKTAGTAVPETTLTLTPSALLRYISTAPHDTKLIEVEGDLSFGNALREIMPQLTWEAEEDLSRLFGDVIAHRMAGTARDLWAWRKQTALNFAHAAAEYLTEEQPLIAKPRHLKTFAQDVDALHNAVMALEQRIEKLHAGQAVKDMK